MSPAVLSQSAQDGFDLLLGQALRASLVPPGQAAELTVLSDLAGIDERQMVVLTVSSYLFRVMLMFHFTPDVATRAHFARLNQVAPGELGDQAFMDAIAECGNLCCGVLNRDLGNFFPHLGMSTPNVIDSRCAAYLQALNATHVRHLAVDIPDTRRFHVSLCISAHADMDFAVSAQEIEVDTGELELF
ncbi:hypothetical protein [Herbaspirillum sp. YR522]|uniref:hypothetical protein n=1 Tax=Herbaspirillum sp. YR522 TaxID=1144342 RepID=UPI00026FB3FB|nr:hypothetical protein [Herbaspirillum sp. YR522]EJM97758.1 hypothetical protein PMI40_04240 [Herbaspirillum sp. YR522]